jgi:hypothetical protein
MKNKKWIGIPIVLIFVSISCILLCCCASFIINPGSIIRNITLFIQAPPYSEPWQIREETKIFLNNIKNGNSDLAYESLTNEYKTKITSPEELASLLHYPIKSFDLPYSRINDENSNICTVIGTIIDDNNIKYAIMIEYIKTNDGNWKINEITIERVKDQ